MLPPLIPRDGLRLPHRYWGVEILRESFHGGEYNFETRLYEQSFAITDFSVVVPAKFVSILFGS